MTKRNTGEDQEGLLAPKRRGELDATALMTIGGIVGGILWGLAFWPVATFFLPADTFPPVIKAAYFGATFGLISGGIVGGMIATRSVGLPRLGFFLNFIVSLLVMLNGGAKAVGLNEMPGGPAVLIWGVLLISFGLGLLILKRMGAITFKRKTSAPTDKVPRL